jgi:thiamine-phosphate pyrophosphorylase
VRAAAVFRRLCDEHDALFWLNDRPELVAACGADGVHVGQDDATPAAARAAIGPERIVGRSTHEPAQADAAQADPDVDYLAVGPVHATPTKPGRRPVGAGLLAEVVALDPPRPWFAIGGIDLGNLDEVLVAGATRVVVVRALTEAPDPAAAAAALAASLHAAAGEASTPASQPSRPSGA